MIYESTRKMSVKEQEAYDLGYLNGKEAALRSPWVKTSDRLPTEADADEEGRIPVLAVGIFTGRLIKMTVHYKVVSANTEGIKYFLPIPLLPEEENE